MYKSLFARDESVTATIEGVSYELDLSELIDSTIYYQGCYEPGTVAVIKRCIKQGMTCFDVGANIGVHTLLLARLAGRSGKVIAFEPTSYAFSKLRRSVELNDFNNVILEKMALSNVANKKSVHIRSSYPLDANRTIGEEEESIEFVTLDEYIRASKIDRFDFIKIDTDGYEYKIVKGGLSSLRHFRPIIVIELCEDTLKKHGDSIETLTQLLAEIGYSFFSEEMKPYANIQSLLRAIPKGKHVNAVCKHP